MDYSLPVSSVHVDSAGKNMAVGCYGTYLLDLFIKQSYSCIGQSQLPVTSSEIKVVDDGRNCEMSFTGKHCKGSV